MASQSFLRAGVQSPARALMRPLSSSNPILKRPAPLPLSPSPFTANFSIVSGSKASPHVHFASSPSMIATFTAHSATTYDRGPILTSPTSAELSTWMGRMLSPTAYNAFKLSDPPKRTPKWSAGLTTLPPPVAAAPLNTLSVPSPYVDPRSPKPYRPRAGVSFEELTLHVPRGNIGSETLGKALTTYPRSPYPSAPPEADEFDITDFRGRSADRADTPSGLARTRSLEHKPRRQGQQQQQQWTAQNLLSPVNESPRIVVPAQKAGKVVSSPDTRLNQEFWAAVTLEDNNSIRPGNSPMLMMFGRQDGSLWSPCITVTNNNTRASGTFVDGSDMVTSPARKKAFRMRKGTVASPSPRDPVAAFPSFTLALTNMQDAITYPPRARVE